METLVIRLGMRHGRLTEFVKVRDDIFTVGRALVNDLVLSDPFVAPEQLRFSRNEKGWNMEVMDFTNPVILNDEPLKRNETNSLMSSGDELILGRTHLVLLAEDHPADATRTMVFSRWLHHPMLRPMIPLLMLVLACSISALGDYLNLVSEVKWGDLATNSLIIVMVAIIWAGQWALIGRLLHHQPNFFAQLYYTSLILAAVSVLGFVEGYVEYMANNVLIEDIVVLTCLFVLITSLLKYNLSYATHIHRKWVTSVLVTGLGALVVFSFSQFNEGDFNTTPDYSAVLRPPMVKLLGNQTLDEFAIDFERQFEIVALEIEKWEIEKKK